MTDDPIEVQVFERRPALGEDAWVRVETPAMSDDEAVKLASWMVDHWRAENAATAARWDVDPGLFRETVRKHWGDAPESITVTMDLA